MKSNINFKLKSKLYTFLIDLHMKGYVDLNPSGLDGPMKIFLEIYYTWIDIE